MTRLVIEDYCHDCPEISPEAKVLRLGKLGAEPECIVTIVCEHADRCHCMYKMLKKKTEGGKP